MSSILSTASLLVGLLALVRCTLEHRAANRVPVVDLLSDRFSRPQRAQVLLGLTLGAVIVLGPLGIAASLGWVRSSPVGDFLGSFWLLSLATIAIKVVWAAVEELIFRGAILHQVSKLTNSWLGLAVSSLLFAWGHLERGGPQTPSYLSLLVFGLDGLGFGLAFLATRSLWLPTIWHAAKNTCIWLLFSQSTLQLTHGMFQVSYSGPALWVGTSHQAGLLDVIASALAAVILMAIYWRPIARGLAWARSQS